MTIRGRAMEKFEEFKHEWNSRDNFGVCYSRRNY